MKYLITGGCGFLGSNIAKRILNNGDNLIIYDNLSRVGSSRNLAWLSENNQQSFLFIKGDVNDFEQISSLIKEEQPNVIYHLAGQVAMTTSIANPLLDFQTNVVGTFNLLESVRRFSDDSIVVYSSTNKVYGDLEYLNYSEQETRFCCIDYPNGFPEEINLKFASPYGCSKGSADQYMLDYAKTFNLKTIVLRHSSMYGARQFGTYDQGWISWFCQQAIKNKYNNDIHFTISGNGKQVRDVLYADDMVDLYLSVPSQIAGAKGEVFNIGGGIENSLSLIELFNLLENILDVELIYEQLPFRCSDQKVFVADISKARDIFLWSPKISFKQGIIKTLNFIENNMKQDFKLRNGQL